MKIEFIPSSQFVADHVQSPKPASAYLPDWYKQAKSGTEKLTLDISGSPIKTFKACMPFRDAMTAGYIQETWSDIFIEAEDDGIRYHYSLGPEPCSHRSQNPIARMPLDREFADWEMTWNMPWIPKVPKGYSVLVTSPFNRSDLPFVVTTGVIDADRFHHSPLGMIPFHVRNGFSGIIPRGTPMFQIVPFKRDNWRATVRKFDAKEIEALGVESNRRIAHHYRDSFWVPKRFR